MAAVLSNRSHATPGPVPWQKATNPVRAAALSRR
jgi:hypothetical protein